MSLFTIIAHFCHLHASSACRAPLIKLLSPLFRAGKSCPILLALDHPCGFAIPACTPVQARQGSCCHLSLNLFQIPLVQEGPGQVQNSRSEQPQVYTVAPTCSSVPLQLCMHIAGQKSPHQSLHDGSWSSFPRGNSSFKPIAASAKSVGEVLGLSHSELMVTSCCRASHKCPTELAGVGVVSLSQGAGIGGGGVPLDC